MRTIGKIRQVQVQSSSLKKGEGAAKYYDPTPLLVVKSLLVTQSGVIGITEEGTKIIDVHHADHPDTRNLEGANGLSIGFTSHYQAMRNKFGPHLTDGRAGENILVETDNVYTLDALGKQLAIQSATTGELCHLTEILVAAPCVPFSTFAAKGGSTQPLSNQQVKETLQFLHNGRRGFYVSVMEHQRETIVQAGDMLFSVSRD